MAATAALHRLGMDLARAAAMAPADVRLIVYRTGLDGVGYARAVVPRRTGNLARSIGVEYETDGMGFALTADEDYASYVEYGTSRMPPQPYLGPSLVRAAAELERKLTVAPLPSLMSLAARW